MRPLNHRPGTCATRPRETYRVTPCYEAFRNLLLSPKRRILTQQMAHPHPLRANWRAPRFRLAETTPAVLQFPDCRLTPGELQVISRTGGLLSLSKPVDQGSVVTLTFRTHRGPVLGTAEMLRPVSRSHQPFRFVGLEEDDQRRLQAVFQSGLYRNIDEEEWIEEFRAAIVNWDPRRPARFFKAIMAAITFATLCLASIYVFALHLR